MLLKASDTRIEHTQCLGPAWPQMTTEIMGLEARLERVESGGEGGKEIQSEQ